MDIEAIKKAYRRYARIYDLYFGPVLHQGRKVVIDYLDCKPGDSILEVGVGTGLSLPLYPEFVKITGIDISPEMLDYARSRVDRDELVHVTDLRVMDAEAMEFADSSFDKVIAMYVASVVPNPTRLVDEMRRVCRPGGELYIVNHFRNTNPVISGIEGLIAPLSRLLGFRPNMCLKTFIEQTDLEVIETRGVNAFGYWTLIRARNSKQSAAPPVDLTEAANVAS